jgi:hypothetical protein
LTYTEINLFVIDAGKIGNKKDPSKFLQPTEAGEFLSVTEGLAYWAILYSDSSSSLLAIPVLLRDR